MDHQERNSHSKEECRLVGQLQKELTNLKIQKASLILHSHTFNKLIRDLNNRIQDIRRVLTARQKTYSKLQNANELLKVNHELLTLELHEESVYNTYMNYAYTATTNEHQQAEDVPDDEHGSVPIDVILRLNGEPYSIALPPQLTEP